MGRLGLVIFVGSLVFVSMAIVMRPSAPWDGLSKCELVEYVFQIYRNTSGANTLREFIENGVSIDVWERGANFHIVLGEPRMGRKADEYNLDFNRWTGRTSFQKIEGDAEAIRARSVEYAECV